MSDLENEIHDLRKKTESNRRQFLKTDLQTCFIALEKGRYELSLGNTEEAQRELDAADRGQQVIEKLLSEMASPMPEIERKFAALKMSVSALRSDLDAYPG